MPAFNGVIIYEILPDGCLNGVYSNDHPNTQNQIFNEIARKNDEKPGEILGVYVCTFIQNGNVIIDCKLEITDPQKRQPKRVRKGQYDFTWYKNGKPIYEGTGWRTRENQITVSYRDM